jgi:hypothetical protein
MPPRSAMCSSAMRTSQEHLLDLILKCENEASASLRNLAKQFLCQPLQPHHASFFLSLVQSPNLRIAAAAAELAAHPCIAKQLMSSHLLHCFSLASCGALPVHHLQAILWSVPVAELKAATEALPTTPDMPAHLLPVFLCILTRNPQCIAAVTRVCEVPAMRAFVSSKHDARVANLLTRMLPFLTARSCMQELVEKSLENTSLAKGLVGSLMYRYLCVCAKDVLDVLQRNNAWDALVKECCTTLRASTRAPRHATHALRCIAPALLLLIISRKMRGRHSAAIALRPHLRQHPKDFRFHNTENLVTLRKIVAMGKLLQVDTTPWELKTNAIQRAAEQAVLLEEAGLADLPHPDGFTCPVTLEVMQDPVVASDGHSYERSSLVRILESTGVSPLTRENLNGRIVVPNINLRKRIRDYATDVLNAVACATKAQKQTQA